MAASRSNITEPMHHRWRSLNPNTHPEQLMMDDICSCGLSRAPIAGRESNCPECNQPHYRMNSNPESPALHMANQELQIVPANQVHKDQEYVDVNLGNTETDSDYNSEDETFKESGHERGNLFGLNNIIWVLNNMLDEDDNKEEVEAIDR